MTVGDIKKAIYGEYLYDDSEIIVSENRQGSHKIIDIEIIDEDRLHFWIDEIKFKAIVVREEP